MRVTRHPCVESVGRLSALGDDGFQSVELLFDCDLPSRYRAVGQSPEGVLCQERVTLSFDSNYPWSAPRITMRPDFPRSLPHVQPWLVGGCPVPCVFDGDLRELIHSEGLLGLVDQIADWLRRAASGDLIDPNHGWEPVRRDALDDFVTSRASAMTDFEDKRGGFRLFATGYFGMPDDASELRYSLYPADHVCRLHDKQFQQREFGTSEIRRNGYHVGITVTICVWPGSDATGRATVCDQYQPEDVSNLAELRDRAELYGCLSDLNAAIDQICQFQPLWKSPHQLPMGIVLMARRPFNLIGRESALELCPYVVTVGPGSRSIQPESVVRAAGHIDHVSPELMRRLSGESRPAKGANNSWTLVGAGSLGSKIGVHLARGGNGPSVVVDHDTLVPHNYARHALLPFNFERFAIGQRKKAEAMAEGVRSLAGECTPIIADVVDLIREKKFSSVSPRGCGRILNATASVRVRGALSAATELRTPVAETGLFSSGQIGYVTVEGDGRNPNSEDLMAYAYKLISDDVNMRSIMVDDTSLTRTSTGHGCGSTTMRVNDAVLSVQAAAMSVVLNQADASASESGRIWCGRFDGRSAALQSTIVDVPPVRIIEVEGGSGWTVRLHRCAESKIEEEVDERRDVETGGVLVGMVSTSTKSFVVVDVLPAPESSVFEADKFVLGESAELVESINQLIRGSGGGLEAIGTWHSHLLPSGPSSIDRSTINKISGSGANAAVGLIWRPDGFVAIRGEAD